MVLGFLVGNPGAAGYPLAAWLALAWPFVVVDLAAGLQIKVLLFLFSSLLLPSIPHLMVFLLHGKLVKGVCRVSLSSKHSASAVIGVQNVLLRAKSFSFLKSAISGVVLRYGEEGDSGGYWQQHVTALSTFNAGEH